MNLRLLVVLLCCFTHYANAESILFDMYLFGNKIGTMTVTREAKENGIENYTLETKSKATFLWVDRNNYTRYEVTYQNGQLLSSNHSESENGKVKRWTKVAKATGGYTVDSYKGKRTFTETPNYSIVTIYFKDIKNVSRIFYEAEADFSTLKKSNEPETWEFKSSDGNRNIYRFEKGKIKSMEFHVSVVTVQMVRVN